VDTDSLPHAATLAAARLLIHAGRDACTNGRHFESPLRRLRALRADGPSTDPRARLSLQIDNLQGLRVHSVDDAGPLIDVPLPAGTYHVTVHYGSVRRRYTMTLESGASFDLHLRLAPDPQ
jgi:hypothetical protein